MKKIVIILFILTVAVWAHAETVTLEIFYLPHRPAIAVVDEIEKTLSGMKNIVIRKYAFGDTSADKLAQKYRLFDHLPVAVFINGTDQYEINGSIIVFRNFPKGNAFVPAFEGEWSYEDLKQVTVTLIGKE